ncbi:hypothetical protein [Evansella tamaricis]|uniref:Uncharacterized protein n=1 Tax=Evansella tamaricis TaxID=2069301 RepID=A0ABS6JN51_9BACI|nr:hypothetical protein [Evansella tamaricis]MBU9713840.1 hypothetical protein [Evansella tamaricis]
MKCVVSHSPLMTNFNRQIEVKKKVQLQDDNKNVDQIIDILDRVLINIFPVFLIVAIPYILLLLVQMFLLMTN